MDTLDSVLFLVSPTQNSKEAVINATEPTNSTARDMISFRYLKSNKYLLTSIAIMPRKKPPSKDLRQKEYWTSIEVQSMQTIFYMILIMVLSITVDKAYCEDIKIEPNRPDLRQIQRVYLDHYKSKGCIEGIKQVDKIIAQNPKDAFAYFIKGLAYHRLAYAASWDYKTKHKTKSYYRLALKNYNMAWKLGFRTAQLYYHRSETYSNLGLYQKSLLDINKSLELNQKRDWVWAHRGAIHSILGNYKQAEKDLQKAISVNPNRSTNFAKLGILHRCQSRYEDAIKDFTKAISMVPKSTSYRMQRGMTYRLMSKYKLAEKDFDTVLKLDPSHAQALAERGKIEAKKGNLEQATQDLFESSALDRTFNRKVLNPSVVISALKDNIQSSNKMLKINPGNKLLLYDRATAYLGLAEYSKASKDFRLALKNQGWKDKWSLHAACRLIIAYRKLNQNSEADKLLSKLSKKSPKSGYLLQLVRYKNGLITGKQLFNRAKSTHEKTISSFYSGMDELLSGNKKIAIQNFNWIQKNGDPSCDEYMLALAELSRLKN